MPANSRWDLIRGFKGLKSIPAAEFYGGIQKLYGRAGRHIELGGVHFAG